MAEPWKVEPSMCGPGWFEVIDDAGFSAWPTEALARRYAALPVLLATIRDGCDDSNGCLFCCSEDGDRDSEHWCMSHRQHEDDCPGIAALKAAGEEP